METGAPASELRLDRVGGPETLPELLAESDFIVLAAPLTPETEDMINAETLAMVKPGAWLINVARGRLIDERALLRALRDGHLGGAVLDTFRDEPLPPMSTFYDLPNVIVTPHTAWSSGRVLDRSVELFCDNLRRFATGEPLAQRRRSERRLLISATIRGCRSPSSGLPARARPPCSTPSPAATPRPAATAG